MKKEEAIKIVKKKYPGKEIDKVTETTNYFLIEVISTKKLSSVHLRPVALDDGLKAVDKANGRVFTYNPIRHGK